MPSRSAASKPSRRTTTKVAPTGYSATILPWFDLLKSSTNTYVPGFSARTRMLTVLPGGTTFSNLSSLLSTSAAFASLFVTTSANGWPALTFTSAGVNFWFSTVIGISTGLLCASAMGRRASVEHAASSRDIVTSRLIAASWGCGMEAGLGIPNHENIVNLTNCLTRGGPRGAMMPPMTGPLAFVRSRIAVKLTFTLVGFVALSMVAAGVYLNHALEAFAVDALEARLITAARLLHDDARALLVRTASPAAVRAFTVRAAEPPGARVTLIALDGLVLGDSEVPAAELPRLENHRDRPEVRAALAGGVGRDLRP